MQQRVPCPKCGVPVDYGSRFCGHCGSTLQWGGPPPSPQAGTQYPYPQQQPPPQQAGPQFPYQVQQPPDQQQAWGQQQQWNQPPPPYNQGNQQPGWGGPPPYYQQQQNPQSARGAMPQKKGIPMSILLLVLLVIIVFTIGGVVFVLTGSSSSGKSASTTPSTTTPTTPPASTPAAPEVKPPQTPTWPTSQATPITAKELISAYSGDSNNALSKYQGNEYAISGVVGSVNFSAPPFLYLTDSTAGPVEIQCSFSHGQEENVSSLNVGQSTKIEGKIGSFTGTILLVANCRIVQ